MNQFGNYEKFDAFGLAKLVNDFDVFVNGLLVEAKCHQ
jgi:hypothetical protein